MAEQQQPKKVGNAAKNRQHGNTVTNRKNRGVSSFQPRISGRKGYSPLHRMTTAKTAVLMGEKLYNAKKAETPARGYRWVVGRYLGPLTFPVAHLSAVEFEQKKFRRTVKTATNMLATGNLGNNVSTKPWMSAEERAEVVELARGIIDYAFALDALEMAIQAKMDGCVLRDEHGHFSTFGPHLIAVFKKIAKNDLSVVRYHIFGEPIVREFSNEKILRHEQRRTAMHDANAEFVAAMAE